MTTRANDTAQGGPPAADPAAAAAIQMLWPVPFLRKRFPEADAVNPPLLALFNQHRREHDQDGGPVYSSGDDLLLRYDDPALNQLFSFISTSVFEIASAMNGAIWQHSPSQKMQLNVVGAWFQIQNQYGFHDTHNHGNCSWCGVYYVQVDDSARREAHPTLGKRNGITRFYGPALDLIGGAYMDAGNLYLQSTHFDSVPEEGVLCVFPSHLKHMALPYMGEKDRVIVSFNAQVHGDGGDGVYPHGFY
jgi:uncharacterized protein (TIGR02466 family)